MTLCETQSDIPSCFFFFPSRCYFRLRGFLIRFRFRGGSIAFGGYNLSILKLMLQMINVKIEKLNSKKKKKIWM